MFLQIVKIVLPIITALCIGVYLRVSKTITEDGMDQIKAMLNDVIIPAVLFNSFLFADYSSTSAVYIFIGFGAMAISYFLSFFTKRFFLKRYQKYFSEHVTTWEGGTIGISLASLLLGTHGLQHMALLDFGCAVLLFGVIVPILKYKDGKKITPSTVLKVVFSSRPFTCACIGALLGMFGFAKFINTHEAVSIFYHGFFDIILSPINFLIMIFVGYSINITKELIVPVFATVFARLLHMSVAFGIACFVMFTFVPFDKKILLVLMVAYSLPPTYSTQIFTNFGGDKHLKEYNSVSTSFITIVTLILFVFISIYANV